MNKKLLVTTMAAAMSANVAAADIDFTITNLTQGIHFTPILVTAHSADGKLFEVGQAATPELQMMAEGGNLDGLRSIATAIGADTTVPLDGLLMPGQSASGSLMDTADGNTMLSVTGMMLPTNDGFIGLDSWYIPMEAGTYTVYLNAYDAGTEANDEIRGSGAPGEAGMPVPPPLDPLLGTSGTGVTTEEANTTVHIHRGNLGDDMMDSGTSDIQNTVQRWLNPVAKLTVIVK